jgi:hypothetical protein
MDIFIEKIVKKRKSVAELLLIFLIAAGAITISYLLISFVPQLAVLIIALLYFTYRLITRFNIEYEYALTNGDLDIDIIIDKRKRKRLLSVNCKDFDAVARVDSSQYTKEIKGCKNIKDYTSNKNNPGTWFISMREEGQHTVILFEPTEKMIKSIAAFIPRKVFRGK